MVGTEPVLVHDGAEHPPGVSPAPAPQGRASSQSGDPSCSGQGPVRPAAPDPPLRRPFALPLPSPAPRQALPRLPSRRGAPWHSHISQPAR